MSEALISSLQSEVNRLNKELADTRAEAKDHRQAKVAAKREAAALAEKLKAAETDRDGWKGKAEAKPSDWQARAEAAETAGRTRDHRDAWKEAIGPELAEKVAIEKVWQEIAYQPGESVPTAEQIKEQAGKAREAAPYLFQSADANASSAAAARAAQQSHGGFAATAPPPGSGRGASDQSSGRFTYRASDLGNPGWMQANQGKLAEAVKAGTAHQLPG